MYVKAFRISINSIKKRAWKVINWGEHTKKKKRGRKRVVGWFTVNYLWVIGGKERGRARRPSSGPRHRAGWSRERRNRGHRMNRRRWFRRRRRGPGWAGASSGIERDGAGWRSRRSGGRRVLSWGREKKQEWWERSRVGGRLRRPWPCRISPPPTAPALAGPGFKHLSLSPFKIKVFFFVINAF